MKEYIVQAIAQETIDSFDAHNAPELIRCKDCVNYKIRPEHRNEKYALGRCDNISYLVGPYWFCADGKRKE